MAVDFGDGSLANALEREIRLRLDGNDRDQGAYKMLLNAPNWDAILRTRGQIEAYQEVLKLVHEIIRRIDAGESLHGPLL